MRVAQTDQGPATGKSILIAACVLGGALAIASIWSLCRALHTPSPHGSVAMSNEAAAPMQEEPEWQHDSAEHRAAPVFQPSAPQPAAIPTNQNNDAAVLQKTKAKVNQQLVERLKQYVKDHPERDNRELEKQIKKRENQNAPAQ